MGAELVELPGVDHDPWVGDGAEVLALVGQFLRAVKQNCVMAK